MSQNHERHRRHHAGADGGVRADGVLSGLCRIIYLGLRHGGFRDRLLRADGAVADAGAVRHAAEAVGPDTPTPRKGLFGWFESRAGGRAVAAMSLCRLVAEAEPDALMLIYVVFLVGALVWVFRSIACCFLPVDDQGFITTDVQTPADSSHGGTENGCGGGRADTWRNGRGFKMSTFLTGFCLSARAMNMVQRSLPEGRSESGLIDCSRHISSLMPIAICCLPTRRQDHRAAAAADRQPR